MYTLIKYYPNEDLTFVFKQVTCSRKTGWHCSEIDGGGGVYVCTFTYGHTHFFFFFHMYIHMQSYSCAAKYTFGFLVC